MPPLKTGDGGPALGDSQVNRGGAEMWASVYSKERFFRMNWTAIRYAYDEIRISSASRMV
jgi:hypothetical protein